MGRPPCCEESTGVKRGPWTPEEDEKLIHYISKHGSGNWRTVPKQAGLNRCSKSCRLRWTNYLRPDIKRGKFTEEEERLIINLHSVLGNKWSKIATNLPGRTDNEIKNFWNTQLRKKLLQKGIDLETHKPRTDFKHIMNLSKLLGMSNNNVMSSWGRSSLGLQQPDLAQLTQIQLLQNLLQLINSHLFVNNMQNPLSDLLGNCNLMNNPLEAYVNGTNSTLLNNKEPFLRYHEANPDFFPPAQSDSCQHVSESWTDLEGTSSETNFGIDNSISCSTSSQEVNEAENPLPAAVVLASFNPMENSSNRDKMSTQSPSSPIFGTLEKFMEDDTSDSYWKELLDLTSNSETPVSW